MDFAFYAKGKDKTQVAIQHHKLKKESDVKKMKEYWKQVLNKLN